jgi:hypothetical protein
MSSSSSMDPLTGNAPSERLGQIDIITDYRSALFALDGIRMFR